MINNLLASLFTLIPLALFGSDYDYEYIGPGKNAVPWFDLFVVAVCVVALAVVVRGVISRRRNH